MSELTRAFEVAEVTSATGGKSKLDQKAFLALPLGDRIKIILEKRVKFFRDGVEIPTKDALKQV